MPWVAKSLLFRVLTCSIEFNACHDESMRSFLTSSACVFVDDGIRVCVGPWRGFKSSVRGPLSFKAFSSRRSSLTHSFVESCADFEVAHFPYSWFGDYYIRDSYLKA